MFLGLSYSDKKKWQTVQFVGEAEKICSCNCSERWSHKPLTTAFHDFTDFNL